jgi:hypothetical protein
MCGECAATIAANFIAPSPLASRLGAFYMPETMLLEVVCGAGDGTRSVLETWQVSCFGMPTSAVGGGRRSSW